MCVPLIIKETLFALSDKFNVSLRHEEEKDFYSSAASLCVRRWVKKNEEKKLCNFILFCEHISALPLVTAVTVLPFQMWETRWLL